MSIDTQVELRTLKLREGFEVTLRFILALLLEYLWQLLFSEIFRLPLCCKIIFSVRNHKRVLDLVPVGRQAMAFLDDHRAVICASIQIGLRVIGVPIGRIRFHGSSRKVELGFGTFRGREDVMIDAGNGVVTWRDINRKILPSILPDESPVSRAAIALAIPAMMLVSFYIFVGIGEYTGWYNPSHYYSMSPN